MSKLRLVGGTDLDGKKKIGGDSGELVQTFEFGEDERKDLFVKNFEWVRDELRDGLVGEGEIDRVLDFPEIEESLKKDFVLHGVLKMMIDKLNQFVDEKFVGDLKKVILIKTFLEKDFKDGFGEEVYDVEYEVVDDLVRVRGVLALMGVEGEEKVRLVEDLLFEGLLLEFAEDGVEMTHRFADAFSGLGNARVERILEKVLKNELKVVRKLRALHSDAIDRVLDDFGQPKQEGNLVRVNFALRCANKLKDVKEIPEVVKEAAFGFLGEDVEEFMKVNGGLGKILKLIVE